MMGIPFGAAFFPTELELPGKEILGLRMFLFSTMMAQLVLTYTSKFNNCVGLQMIENVPFYLELARITIAEGGGNGESAISTLFFLFGASSVIVGLVFYLLGRFELGRVLYFFPKHVLVGCIGGIGLFIVVTALEVSTNTAFSLDAGGIDACIVRNFRLLLPVLAFEVVLRSLMRLTTSRDGVDRYPLLGPIYYCCITPAFYAVLLGAGISPKSAEMEGYFFPPFISSGSAFDGDIFRIFTMVDPSMISWKAVVKCIPTILGLTAFSLIHVPINIPAFGVSELCVSLNILYAFTIPSTH
jgi:SulP family sulfate permease